MKGLFGVSLMGIFLSTISVKADIIHVPEDYSIIQAGIKRLVYRNSYRITDGVDLLVRAGVDVLFLSEE